MLMGGPDEEKTRSGMRSYYATKLRELDVIVSSKEANLKRLEAQRNELNGRGVCVACLFFVICPARCLVSVAPSCLCWCLCLRPSIGVPCGSSKGC
jgi:hypothetical protein